MCKGILEEIGLECSLYFRTLKLFHDNCDWCGVFLGMNEELSVEIGVGTISQIDLLYKGY